MSEIVKSLTYCYLESSGLHIYKYSDGSTIEVSDSELIDNNLTQRDIEIAARTLPLVELSSRLEMSPKDRLIKIASEHHG